MSPRLCRAARNFYLVINNYGNFGPAFAETDVSEADLETTITDLMSGQYNDPVGVVALNTAEHWSADVSQDVAHEIGRRADLAGDDLAPSIAEFVETHAGPARQLVVATDLGSRCHGIRSFSIRSCCPTAKS